MALVNKKPLVEGEFYQTNENGEQLRAMKRMIPKDKEIVSPSPDTYPGIMYLWRAARVLRDGKERYLRDFGFEQDLDSWTSDYEANMKEMIKRPAQVSHAMLVDLETNLSRLLLALREDDPANEDDHIMTEQVQFIVTHAVHSIGMLSETKVAGLREQMHERINGIGRPLTEDDIYNLKETERTFGAMAGFCFHDHTGQIPLKNQGKQHIPEYYPEILERPRDTEALQM